MVSSSPEAQLHEQFVGRPWFHSVGRDQYKRLVVYTHFMCHETLHDIPDRVDGIQVMVHFAGSLTATREQFTGSTVVSPPLPKPVLILVPEESEPFDLIELDSDELENDVDDLCKELNRIEKKCGSNIMQDIFYEIHDGPNAVTQLGSRYPEVRDALQKLYDEYGFDVIYEEMDG